MLRTCSQVLRTCTGIAVEAAFEAALSTAASLEALPQNQLAMQKLSKRKMKALVVTALGDPTGPLDGSVLKLSIQQPVPQLPSGHVRIRIVAAALNFADILQVQGSYQVGLRYHLCSRWQMHE